MIVTGYGIGEGAQWGGLAEFAKVKPEWMVKLPQGMKAEDAMAIGTAGFTAMQCVMALQEHGVKPESGEVIVTGAAGGVGSVAVVILAHLGYKVVALTGRVAAQGEYLKSLGASRVMDRKELEAPGKPIDAEKWAGAVDTVGGQILSNVISQVKYRGLFWRHWLARMIVAHTSSSQSPTVGAVAACGLAASNMIPNLAVFPFILRGGNLLGELHSYSYSPQPNLHSRSIPGIDSVQCPADRRAQVWARLAKDLPIDKLRGLTKTVGLEEAIKTSHEILKGGVAGRVVVDVSK